MHHARTLEKPDDPQKDDSPSIGWNIYEQTSQSPTSMKYLHLDKGKKEAPGD